MSREAKKGDDISVMQISSCSNKGSRTDMSDRSDFPRLEGTNITIYTSALKRALVGVGQVDQ